MDEAREEREELAALDRETPKSALDEELNPWERQATLHGERGIVFCYVGGSHPYLWIGDKDGRFIDAVTVARVEDFLEAWRD